MAPVLLHPQPQVSSELCGVLRPPAACLGLVLGYTRTLSLFSRCSIKLLYKVLKEEPSARVEIPSEEEIRVYQEVIFSNFPVLGGTWCVVDRLKIKIQKSGDTSRRTNRSENMARTMEGGNRPR